MNLFWYRKHDSARNPAPPPPLSEIFLKILVVAFRHIPEALDDFMPHMIAYNAGK